MHSCCAAANVIIEGIREYITHVMEVHVDYTHQRQFQILLTGATSIVMRAWHDGLCVCSNTQTSHADYWTSRSSLPPLTDLIALDRMLDPNGRQPPKSEIVAQLRRIIKVAISLHTGGCDPSAAARMFEQINTLVTPRLLRAVPRISNTITDAIASIRITSEMVDFFINAVNIGFLSLRTWDAETTSTVFHRIGTLCPAKHAACIRMGLSFCGTTPTQRHHPFQTIVPIMLDVWKHHHPSRMYNISNLDENIADLAAHRDHMLDGGAAAAVAVQQQLTNTTATMINYRLFAGMLMMTADNRATTTSFCTDVVSSMVLITPMWTILSFQSVTSGNPKPFCYFPTWPPWCVWTVTDTTNIGFDPWL